MSVRNHVIEPGETILRELGDYWLIRAVVGQKYGDVAVELIPAYYAEEGAVTPGLLFLGTLPEIARLHGILTDILAEAAAVKLRQIEGEKNGSDT